jgi:pentose-5-phosphate-3-epimerase
MIDDVNNINQRKFCQALFYYCEVSQDYRDWDNAIHEFLKLLKIAKRKKYINTAADAGVHLVRIHRKKSANLFEWLGLIRNLGVYGMMALFKVVLQERKRLFSGI